MVTGEHVDIQLLDCSVDSSFSSKTTLHMQREPK